MDLKSYIVDVQDFPKPGILFKDISPLLYNPKATQFVVEQLVQATKDIKVSKIVGIESRGFYFGTLLASKLGVGFCPVRKPGKLPGPIASQSYDLEYGKDVVEIQRNAILKGERILLHDDVLATGGTAHAACKLIEKCGGIVVGTNFLLELNFLKGRERLQKYNIVSLLRYD